MYKKVQIYYSRISVTFITRPIIVIVSGAVLVFQSLFLHVFMNTSADGANVEDDLYRQGLVRQCLVSNLL